MTTRLTIAVSLLVGAAVGATAIDGLKAQGKGPAYVVAIFTEVSDPAAFAAGAKGMPAAVTASGGKVLARTEAVIALDASTPPKRIAIVQFESADKAKAWIQSDAMKEAEAGRAKYTKSGLYLVEGLGN